MKRLTLGELVSGFESRLEISYVSGKKGLNKETGSPAVQIYKAGNILMPGLLILSHEKLHEINSMADVQIFAFLNRLLDYEISFVVISEHGRPPQAWRDFSESHGIVLCVSRQDAYLLESRLTGLIRENSDGVKIIHANLVAVNNQGVLLTGEAGSGKTRCGIALMQRGHQWIADDTVVLEKKSPTRIIGRAHEATQGLIHLRGRGILRVEDCLKDISVRGSATINLIVELDLFRNGPWTDEPAWSVQEIMGVPISHVKMLHRGQAGKTAAKLLEHAAYCLQGRVE